MAFTFRVFTADGDDLDDYVASVPNWDVGDVLYEQGRPKWRISAIVPVDDFDNGVYNGVWEVIPLEPAERAMPSPR